MRSTRFEVMHDLRRVLGATEKTEILIDWLQDAWQTYDVLIGCIGEERAQQMITTRDLFSEVAIRTDAVVDQQSVSVPMTLP